MPAILSWFLSTLLAGVVGEVFKKAAIFVAFNIILQFVLAYITGHGVNGITLFGVGSAVSDALSTFMTPGLVYAADRFYVIQGVFLVMNAMLARFAYRLTIRAVTGG